MSVRVGIVMDPIASISYKKDSSLAMLLAAQKRGWELFYMEQRRFVPGRRRSAGADASAESLRQPGKMVRTGRRAATRC